MTAIRNSLILIVLLFGISAAVAQPGTLDALERALRDSQKLRDESEENNRKNFVVALDRAVNSNQAAVEWYKQCGGNIPEIKTPKPIARDGTSLREREEYRDALEAVRQQEELLHNSLVTQFQLMRFAHRFATMQEGAVGNAAWEKWLTAIVNQYGVMRESPVANQSMKASPVVQAYNLKDFDGKPEGDWSIRKLPDLYRQFILEPLRWGDYNTLSNTWDNYIRIRSHDFPNRERWEQFELPWLEFEKGVDLFRLAPSDVKLTELVNILRKHPRHPRFDQMHSIAAQLLEELRKRQKAQQAG